MSRCLAAARQRAAAAAAAASPGEAGGALSGWGQRREEQAAEAIAGRAAGRDQWRRGGAGAGAPMRSDSSSQVHSQLSDVD